MNYLLFLYLALFPLGQLISLQLGDGFRLHPVDVVAATVAFLWFAEILWRRKDAAYQFSRPFWSFIGVALFSLVLAGISTDLPSLLKGSFYLIRFTIYVFFYFAVGDMVRSRSEFLKKLPDGLLVAGIGTALTGWFQYLMFPDTRPLAQYGWDDHFYRLIGSFLDPAFTGLILLLTLLLIAFRKWETLLGRAFAILSFAFVWGAFALTYSRASYVGLVSATAGFFAIWIFQNRDNIVRRVFATLIALVVISLGTIFLLPRPGGAGTNLTRTSTIAARFTNYEQAVEVAKENPLFGIGFNLYAQKASLLENDKTTRNKPSHSGVHSSLLFVYTTTGISGLLVYIFLWWHILKTSWTQRNTPGGGILFCSGLAVLTHSVFDNSLFYPWIMGWMGILLALTEKPAVKGYKKR